ncbi:hypothetical protein EDC56_1803 [Sinobacterium caligoides]|uniref:Peptidase n=1 Tax=Sinobacterium caligoides TaxID=933926 RepID=A0A3N2DNT8_9GAMM|nr:zinc-dependent peptidase [Sinobacterium caligoides]ROS01362.1 hypothetical protein EDC56_1803 [Sinobacterium caligoides]
MFSWVKHLFGRDNDEAALEWQPQWSAFLAAQVAFYRVLTAEDKRLFEQRVLLFLQTTRVEAAPAEVSDEDCLLVAASAIIPVWGFPGWHYFNLRVVYLLPGAFNHRYECGQSDSTITGMVGTGDMVGRMALSRPALYQGFANSRDRSNVGIHEFVHLIDMADGECDGYPERMKEYAFSIPWFELVAHKIHEIEGHDSNIDPYAMTNRSEFFAVTSEYFFERPKMMQRKHPQLFAALSAFYQQDVLAIEKDVQPRKDQPCPCGSERRYRDCCMPVE